MNKQQPEVLRLADELCEAIAEYPEPTALEAQAAAELRRQHARITELESQLAQRFDAADMATAAQAVVDRWDTPLWKDVPATAEYIGRLRAALAAGQATAARQPHRSGCTAGSDEECVQRGCGTNCPAVSPRQGVAYAALPESFLEIPDVQDESGINAYYSREAVLECIDAALASHGQASSQAGEYPALVCDYCGALTPDPWHSSGMLHGKMSKHIHSCDACAARGAAHGIRGAQHGTE